MDLYDLILVVITATVLAAAIAYVIPPWRRRMVRTLVIPAGLAFDRARRNVAGARAISSINSLAKKALPTFHAELRRAVLDSHPPTVEAGSGTPRLSVWRIVWRLPVTLLAGARIAPYLVYGMFRPSARLDQLMSGAGDPGLDIKRMLLALLKLFSTPIWLAVIIVVCLHARHDRRRYRASGAKPRLVWGPYPNMSVLDVEKALKPLGYVCHTIVYYNFERIWKGAPFTYCLADHYRHLEYQTYVGLCSIWLYPKTFLRIIREYDVVHGNFYPGYLRDTYLEKLELPFLHLAGCKRISISTGGDVAYLTDIDSHLIRQGMQDMYPELTRPLTQRSIRKWIEYYSVYSDLILCQNSYMIDTLPRWDVLVTSYLPIDTERWQSDYYSNHDGRNGAVSIGHSPNHRPLKGTNFLIRAVNELRAEGYKIELRLLEHAQNTEVRDVLATCDIVVADVVLQGYSVMAMEGLALARPVVQDISDPHYNRVYKLYTGMDEAPFVSVPLEGLREALRSLIENPGLRRELGRKGREYALKYHSYEANARFWDWIYDYLWFEQRERVAFYHPDWPLSTITALNSLRLTYNEIQLGQTVNADLAFQRVTYQGRRIGFGPLHEGTVELVNRMIRARAIRSNDALVSNGTGPIPERAIHFSQDIMPARDFLTSGIEMLYLLERDGATEESLSELDSEIRLSVNDRLLVEWPRQGEVLERPYRRLRLRWCPTVVQPLHYSNYAYIQYLKRFIRPGMTVADVFTGPGTIGLSLMKETAADSVALIDLNPEAVRMCRENIALNFPNRSTISVHESDVLASIPRGTGWDLIVGNPPHNYDRESVRASLTEAVYIQAHDPGMAAHRRLFSQARDHLELGGTICLLENGEDTCIQPNHLLDLLHEFPSLEANGCEFLPMSQFYVFSAIRVR